MFYGRNNRSTASAASDVPQYRTTEQLRDTHLTLSALHEDAETPSATNNLSSSFSQFSVTTPSNYAASTPGNFSNHNGQNNNTNQSTTFARGFSAIPTTVGSAVAEEGELERLRAEVLEVKEEVKAIRREVMNELHVTRYDVLKELALLKGAVAQLTAAQHSSPVRFVHRQLELGPALG